MTFQDKNPEEPVPVPLSYDTYSAVRDPRGRLVFIWFWAGGLTSCVVYMGVLGLRYLDRNVMEILYDILLIPPMFSALMLLLGTVFLAFNLWLRLSMVKQIRFAGFRTAFITGAVFGVFPAAMVWHLPRESRGWLLLGMLAWAIGYPAVATFWLAPRSSLRD